MAISFSFLHHKIVDYHQLSVQGKQVDWMPILLPTIVRGNKAIKTDLWFKGAFIIYSDVGWQEKCLQGEDGLKIHFHGGLSLCMY